MRLSSEACLSIQAGEGKDSSIAKVPVLACLHVHVMCRLNLIRMVVYANKPLAYTQQGYDKKNNISVGQP